MTYELMVLAKPMSIEEFKESFLPRFEKKCNEFGANVSIVDFLGKKSLAYSIKGLKEGTYCVFTVSIDESKKIKNLRRSLDLNQDIVRYLLLRK